MLISQSTTSGFYKVPVSKSLIISTLLASSAIHLPSFNSQFRQYLNCQVPQILTSSQIWRLLFNRLTFIHSKDIICSILVIYYFRIFERRFGSKKFASHLLGSCCIATLLEIFTILLLSYLEIDLHNNGHLPPGLYSLIFPFFVNYYMDIPRSEKMTSIFFIPITGKTLTYLLGLQIACNSPPATIISSLCGICGGILYRLNFLKVKKWLKVPNSFANFCEKIFGWILYSNEPKHVPMGATLELQRAETADLWEQQYFHNRSQDFRSARIGQGFAERLINNDPAEDGLMGYFMRQRRPAGGEPSQENVQTLVDMGFRRNEVIEALQSSNNDLQAATSILLSR